MTYRVIAATETDPFAPITAALMKALAGNLGDCLAGDTGAPRIRIGALQRLTPGTTIRSETDTTAATSAVGPGSTIIRSLGFLQAGTVRISYDHRYNGTGTASQGIDRVRNGTTTAVAASAGGSNSYATRTVDIDVLPGDQLNIYNNVGTGAAVTTNLRNVRLGTNGEELFPGSGMPVTGSTFNA